jgi:hypothetical protein
MWIHILTVNNKSPCATGNRIDLSAIASGTGGFVINGENVSGFSSPAPATNISLPLVPMRVLAFSLPK